MTKNFEDGISVVIPCFNEKEYLFRAILSVASQDFRPIQIVIADDSTDTEVISLPEIRSLEQEHQLEITYKKNQQNLGFYLNFRNSLQFVKHRFYVLLLHDDYYTDFNFFSKAIFQLKNTNQINCYIANSQDEETGVTSLNTNQNSDSRVLNPRDFIKGIWSNFHSNHSSIVLNFEILMNLGYMNSLIDRSEIEYFKKSADEGFVSLFLISQKSNFYIDYNVVVTRGHNPHSWSRSEYWGSNMGYCMFLTYYYFQKNNKYLQSFSKRSLNQAIILRYPITRLDLEFYSKIGGLSYRILFLASYLNGQRIRLINKVIYEYKKRGLGKSFLPPE